MTENARGTDVTEMKRTYRTATGKEFPNELTITLTKQEDLKYGENPNQPAAIYVQEGTNLAEITNIHLIKGGKGGLSATNFMDVTRAMDVLKFFEDPSVTVMKHLVPSGASKAVPIPTSFAKMKKADDLSDIYVKARDTDARSAFGSIVVSNVFIDKATAEAIMSSYVEGVAAPGFEEGVMPIFEKKKDIRIIGFSNLDKIPKFIGDDIDNMYHIMGLPTGRVLVQKPYLSSITCVDDFITDPMVVVQDKQAGTETRYVVTANPTPQELDDLLTAWYVNLGVRSNGVVFVRDGVTVAVGTGQQERVGAVEQAIVKAYQKEMDRQGIKYDTVKGILSENGLVEVSPLRRAVCSSDAFFPFRDSVDTMARFGVTAVVQPGGSVKDYEVIQAVNEHNMAMAYTLERCFGHF